MKVKTSSFSFNDHVSSTNTYIFSTNCGINKENICYINSLKPDMNKCNTVIWSAFSVWMHWDEKSQLKHRTGPQFKFETIHYFLADHVSSLIVTRFLICGALVAQEWDTDHVHFLKSTIVFLTFLRSSSFKVLMRVESMKYNTFLPPQVFHCFPLNSKALVCFS